MKVFDLSKDNSMIIVLFLVEPCLLDYVGKMFSWSCYDIHSCCQHVVLVIHPDDGKEECALLCAAFMAFLITGKP